MSCTCSRWLKSSDSYFTVHPEKNAGSGVCHSVRSNSSRRGSSAALDERRVEGSADRQRDDALGAGGPGLAGERLERRLGAAHDDLAGAVEVRRPGAVLLGAERLDDGVVQTDDRHHAARVGVGGAQHLLTAPPHDAQRVLEVDGAGRDQRRELAQAVPDGDVEPQAFAAQHAEHADGRREQRRLREVGAAQPVHGPLAAEVLQVVAEHLRRLGVGVAHLGLGGRQVAAHTDGL